jgi:hypothetical protein
MVVAKETAANKELEHFTLSSSGVVHIRPGRAQCTLALG